MTVRWADRHTCGREACGDGLKYNRFHIDGAVLAHAGGAVDGPIFSADSTASVGEMGGAPICDDFARSSNNALNGRVHWVHIDIGADSHDHYIDDEERVRIAVSLQ